MTLKVGQTDIHRLHQVILGENTDRGAGKTYANIHHLAGCIQTSDCMNFFIVGHHHTIQLIKPMIEQVFKEHEITIKSVERHGSSDRFLWVEYEGKAKQVRIMLNRDLEMRLAGSRGNFIINDDTFLTKDMELIINQCI